MDVSVRFSSELARYAGNAHLQVALEEGATVGDLIDQLCLQHPSIAEKIAVAVAVVSGQTVGPLEPLEAGQEVALLTPMSGGE